MLFNSYIYILFFLPLTVILYYLLSIMKNGRIGIGFLSIMSIAFYGYWNPIYIPLILLSIFINYVFGFLLQKVKLNYLPKIILLIAVAANLLLLGYYKYIDFFITNINTIFSTHLAILNIVLPLGISFFTFTQIAYLVDSYKKKVKEINLLNYLLFVTFFPHLLAGPIIHHAEMMPQFSDKNNKKIIWENFYAGLLLFAIGLFKKSVIADYFAYYVLKYFHAVASNPLSFWESWVASLSYTMQIYFDFSGYTDMAIGTALLFNIHLPLNFNSPYKAISIQDFWRRWHMTLSRFLKDYIYIPLGGNRLGKIRTDINVIIVFLLGGLWHGAAWTFILWGALHGIGYLMQHIWSIFKFKMHRLVALLITFLFINITWVFFRAENFHDAFSITHSMLLGNGVGESIKQLHLRREIIYLAIAILACFMLPNSNQVVNFVKNRTVWFTSFFALLGTIGILAIGPNTPFIYFQF